MKLSRLSIGVLFLLSSTTGVYAQQTKNDSIKKEREIEGVVIRGSRNKQSETALIVEQKKAIIQKQAIGSEEISRKGISTIEQGLAKVTGINTVQGRGIFVRGLEERYNYLLINGLATPSNNPFNKIVSLDQFPTDIVGKLDIYKTFNTNLYGDFAGATFDIETLTPTRDFTKIEFGIGFNTESTLKNNFKVSENAYSIDGYLTLNSKDRALPQVLQGTLPVTYNFSKQQSANDFKDSWDVASIKALPNTSIGFITSQRLKVGERGKLGFVFGLNQANKYIYRAGAYNQFIQNGDETILNNLLERKKYSYQIESSSLIGLSYKQNKTNINLNALYLQNADNSISDYIGFRNNEPQNIRFIRGNQMDVSRFLNLQLLASQELGERHMIKAGVGYVKNYYAQPDRKFFDGRIVDNDHVEINYGGNNLIRQYLENEGKFFGSGFGEYSVSLGEKRDEGNYYPLKIAVGYNGYGNITSNSYRFIFGALDQTNSGTVVITKDTPQETFNNSIQQGIYHYREESDPGQYYSSFYQFVNAGYANINYKPNASWDILLGARFENDLRMIRYSELSVTKKTNLIKDNDYFLPSLSIKKSINDKNNVRLAFSKTITRPVSIEVMPISYINPDNETIIGNINLANSENYNIDLKWEFFPTNKELFAVNLFGKKINDAIERAYIASANSNGVTVSFLNAKSATLAGIEVEGLINLGRLSEKLDKFSFGANATFMYSDVERSENQLTQERKNGFEGELPKRELQGAAPFVINADLKYDFKTFQNLKNTLSLVYNVTGSKIYTIGTAGNDHIYEKPFHQLDLIYQTELSKNWKAKVGINNILNNVYRLEIGNEGLNTLNTNNVNTLQNYKRGTNINLTIGYTF